MSTARILAVDDAPQIRRVLKTTLVSAGYETLTAASGEEALELFAHHRPDLVILDLALPGMSGVEVCRRLRGGTDTPILVLSVRGAEADKIEALDAGADDYLTKPFGSGELLARIRSALRRSVPAAGAVLEAGPIRLDVAARRAWNGAEELKLTPKEFDLLRQFASRPGRVLTHRALLQAVWGPDYGEQTEYLRVFVNQLRKKIEADPSRPQLLRTEPWVGYRLLPPE
ncbi:MAG: response regulator transcription factor [Terriglobales bacterium]